ncbi:MAG: PKD domain-containing protein, partial [bacterium]|nr:PKD domain-containing protein [bacterium]
MNISHRSMVIVVITLLFILGCSSNNSQPIAPNEAISQPVLTGNADANENNADASSHYLLAYNFIYIDPNAPDGPKIEVIPVREAEIHLNILKFLEGFPCANCFKIVGFNIPQPGYLNVDLEVDHPFPDLTYSVFDVRGIMMFPGTHEFPVAGKSASDPLFGDGALLNPDGYTALYNGSTITAPIGDLQKYYQGKFATSAIPDSDINGFRYYITDNPANNRNAFFAGSSDVQTFSLKLPPAPLVLGYAVDASWWMPISTPVDDPLTDFDTNANCPEPWKISVTEQPIGQGLTDAGGQTKLLLDVYDWQGKSTYHAPVIECPEIFDSTLTSTWVMDGSDYSQYEVTISNTNMAAVGEYTCLIGVEDNGNDPVGKPWLDLSAYQLQNLTVVTQTNQPPVAIANASPNPQFAGQPVHFVDDGSYDPDGTIIQYKWDWENDGVYDEVGDNLFHTWPTAGTYYVQFRVMDDDSATDALDQPMEIVIQPADLCEGPDESEPNENAVEADSIGDLDIEGYACVGEFDFFVLQGQQGNNPTITLTYDDSLGDINLDVYSDTNYVGGLYSEFSPDSGPFSVPGVCYFKVYAFTGEGAYTIDISPAGDPCEGLDESEPNETSVDADSIGDLDIEGFACTGELDWFVLQGQQGTNPTITLTYDSASYDIDLYIYSDTTLVGSLTNTGSPDSGTFSVPGVCYLVAEAWSGEGAYTIDISPAGGCEGPDESEPNETKLDADSIGDLDIEGYACAGESDWFVLQGQEGTYPNICLNYDSGLCDIDLNVYSDTDHVGTLNGIGSPDCGDFSVPGVCYLEVWAVSAGGSYTIDITPANPCQGLDETEPNENSGEADSISSYNIQGHACVVEEDWFVLQGQEGTLPNICLNYDSGLCDIDMYIFSDSNYVGGLINTSSPDCDDFYVPGVCYLEVWANSGEGDYTIDITPANPCQGLDESEPNETSGTADSIADYYIEGHACATDLDWFVLQGQQGTHPTITLTYDDS